MTSPGLPEPRETPGTSRASGGEPLSEAARARGRRIAIAGHPIGMIFHLVFTQHLPTLALVSLGASEAVVGAQNGLVPMLQTLQLPTLRAIGRISKRTILLAGQVFALIGALPLLAFGTLAERGDSVAIAATMACLAVASVGVMVGNTVWFPMLRAYVDDDRIGRFFGVLRSGWHLSLIVYYAAAQRWLATHPGSFAPLFAVGWLCGLIRLFFLARMPERSELTGEPIQIRDALQLVFSRRPLRRYLFGVTATAVVRLSTFPFAIVLLRREIGFSDAEVLYTTIALFGGGLVSLYLWGRVVDRIGPEPIFRWTAVGSATLTLLFVTVSTASPGSLAVAVGIIFGLSVLSSGFGVADTRVLFALTPADAPARILVVVQVTVAVVASTAPLLAGVTLDVLLSTTEGAPERIAIYHGFFVVAAAARLAAYFPLRSFRRGGIYALESMN